MSIRYLLHKWIGSLWKNPIIPIGKTYGYSLSRSERSDCIIEKNTRVYPPFFLHKVKLGRYSYIAKNCSISNCEIGRFCSIGPNFCCGMGIHPTEGISTSPMFYSTSRQNGLTICEKDKVDESHRTVIGNDVFIGVNVTVLDGVTIGDGAVIGAGAVVTKDIPPYAIAMGVPAEVKKYRFDEQTIQELLIRRWWYDSQEALQDIEKDFFDVQAFLNKKTK